MVDVGAGFGLGRVLVWFDWCLRLVVVLCARCSCGLRTGQCEVWLVMVFDGLVSRESRSVETTSFSLQFIDHGRSYKQQPGRSGIELLISSGSLPSRLQPDAAKLPPSHGLVHFV